MHVLTSNRKRVAGFTIVELLIVIVVIGILAAITIIAYSGIQQRAVASSLQSDLTNASNQLKLFQVDNNAYPASITNCPTPATGNACFKTSPGTTYQYATNGTANSSTFCITANNGDQYYKITDNNNVPVSGDCQDYGLLVSLDAGDAASYPGTGTIWSDLSSNGNNGTLQGSVTYSNANGGALSFNGVNSYVSSPLTAVGMNKPFTMLSWIKTSQTYAYQPGIVSLGYYPVVVMQSDGKVRAWWYDGTTYPQVISAKACNDGVFHHIGLTYDGTTAKLYIDGVMESTTTAQAYSIHAGFYVGSEHNSGQKIFNGLISYARAYNRALTADEVSRNFNSLRSRYGL